ncbi:family 43 glycosylhydrolase [Desertivirga arenae]|uniref:family 43 glycosylhydrolase n=1 Tax=Desertivirga arenae TaxID=2810309 RepID=UPI001A95F34E|nr:family 43 glycosylhydrolase [Pedobacter sp. SYSU D00823]
MKRLPIFKLMAAIFFIASACQKGPADFPGTGQPDVPLEPGATLSSAPLGTLVDSGIYRIRGLASIEGGPVVEVAGKSKGENAMVHQWTWFPNNAQKWQLIKADSNYYQLKNAHSNRLLESPSSIAGAILQQGKEKHSDAHLWKITYTGSNNLFTLTNKGTGMKMVLDPDNNVAGSKIRQNVSVTGKQDVFNFHNLYYQNPLIDVSRADPYVAEKDGSYYFMYTRGDRLGLRKTKWMSLVNTAREVVVWTPPAGTAYSKNIWAPELHFLEGKWYLYFAANDGQGDTHRMYVLENSNADPTTGTWTFKGKISDPSDQWAIDGTVLTIGSNHYFVWSGWESVRTRYKQYIYLASMSNPWTINSNRVRISAPTETWEKHEPNSIGLGVNEAPIMLQKDEESPVFIIYSASRYSSDNYCLAQIQLKDGGNPLNTDDWINKKQVFVKSEANAVYGPGHNGFFTSSFTDPDKVTHKENWFIYHARSAPNTSGPRTPRMQKLTWNADGSPNFGTAIGQGVSMQVPVGE